MELKERLELYRLWSDYREHNKYGIIEKNNFYDSLSGESVKLNNEEIGTGEAKEIIKQLRELGYME